MDASVYIHLDRRLQFQRVTFKHFIIMHHHGWECSSELGNRAECRDWVVPRVQIVAIGCQRLLPLSASSISVNASVITGHGRDMDCIGSTNLADGVRYIL